MTAHHLSLEKLEQALNTDLSNGLTTARAQALLAQYGENRLEEGKRRSLAARFLDQLKDAMILILLAAAAVSLATALYEGDRAALWEPVLILLIVVLNAALGAAQESRAEQALTALRGMTAPMARVIREGSQRPVPATALVPGDVIVLEAGDLVPADARLLQASALKAEESALTGESLPAEKDADVRLPEQTALGDRRNMVFSGCAILNGTATAVVTATGMDTEIGRIAGLLAGEPDAPTPLQETLAALGRKLGAAALIACAVIFVLGLLSGMPVGELFMTAVSLAVSAIPEGLPAIVTIVLSLGVQRMAARNAIIRRLPAVETLGSAGVICSDKTGTLTQNRMTLTAVWTGAQGRETPGTDLSEQARQLLAYAALCCDATVTFHGDREERLGDPTETAILSAARNCGVDRHQWEQQLPRTGELPFDSDRKRMTTIHRREGGTVLIVKGALESLLPLCVAGARTEAAAAAEELSREALRVLAVAVRELDGPPESVTADALERDLTLLGLVGMIDPPRPEAKAAVELCRQAGIRPVMITGDHVATASAIAGELGILRPGDRAVTGGELSAMSEAELDSAVEDISVYARVSPEDKIRIVKAWQRRGKVAAMTGDGVNDAPALKAANIGCAMGRAGTEVARGASDMILTDDNFATIVEAVREGRGIYDNIRKVVGFLLGTNIGEVLAVLFAMLLWRETPLRSMQLLWINLVTDSLPAIALGLEPVEADIMERPPRPAEEGLFAHGLGIQVVCQGVLFGTLCLAGYALGRQLTGTLAGGQTMAFLVLAVSQIVQAFNMRSARPLGQTGVFTNRALNGAAAVSLGLMALAVFTPMVRAFGLATLSPALYAAALALSLVPVAVMEVYKKFRNGS